MRFFNKALDSLAHGQAKILVFDCEFWHVLGEPGDKQYIYQQNSEFFFMPRELGGFLLTKNVDGSWNYREPFFVTITKPKRGVAFPVSHYSTVTQPTAILLDKIEQQLGIGWGEAYPSRLSIEGRKLHAEGVRAYENDPNIKSHHKPPSWYQIFMKHYSESLIVVKGNADIEALQNAATYYGFEYKLPRQVHDIAVWNPQSRRKCRTAKLAGTFDCIKTKLDPETKALADYLPLEKAHDPSTDASMTLLVALYIQTQKPI